MKKIPGTGKTSYLDGIWLKRLVELLLAWRFWEGAAPGHQMLSFLD
jgi:hypothetical protein